MNCREKTNTHTSACKQIEISSKYLHMGQLTHTIPQIPLTATSLTGNKIYIVFYSEYIYPTNDGVQRSFLKLYHIKIF